MKVLIKGGVWKNTEDEILKAAIMKYGKNQWARISSLLTRKTPKQCKARWYEWLDPSIKKTEWAKEEDEKLLHLAKLMPTQWRTIAPIVGRTPAQCLERYQRLLDEAEADGDVGPSSDDVRKLRPGEVDPDPETKPARPDPVDMDEDEKEMLSEARARLANTQGKKAKRKAREKQLEEARRLAALQKRRELKAAGLHSKLRHRVKGVDYNADIPFYKPQPAGFWDTNEEIDREKHEKVNLAGSLLSKLEGKRRREIEEEERKKDAKKLKAKKEAGDLIPAEALKQAQELTFSSRQKLSLPAPQVSEAELEEIVKLGSAADTARSIVTGSEDSASSELLGDYSTVRGPTPMRTPRVAAETDTIQQQARNLKAMTFSQTPLLGGELNLEGSMDYSGATPRKTVAATPNPLAAHLTPRSGNQANSTPSVNVFGKTPLRDQMGINTPMQNSSSFDETPRSVKGQQAVVRQQLSSLFNALPKPKNDFEIVLPELPQGPEETAPGINLSDADAEDVIAQKEAMVNASRDAELARRTKSVKLGLPRPVVLVDKISLDVPKSNSADALIEHEKSLLIYQDALKYPVPGQPTLPANVDMDLLEDKYLEAANDLITKELESLKLDQQSLFGLFLDQHESITADTLFLYEWKGVNTRSKSSVPQKALERSWEIEFEVHKESMKKQALTAQKLEKKLHVTLGGYMARSRALRKEFSDLVKTRDDALIELATFEHLKNLEQVNTEHRIARARKEIETLAMIEQDLQDGYRQRIEARS